MNYYLTMITTQTLTRSHIHVNIDFEARAVSVCAKFARKQKKITSERKEKKRK